MPALLIVLSMVAQQALPPPTTPHAWRELARLVFFIVLNFEAGRQMILLARKKYPGAGHTKKRVLVSYLFSWLVSAGVITLSTLVSRLYTAKPIPFWDETLLNGIQVFWIAILIVAPYEVLYSYTLLLHTEKEKERLQKAQVEGQLHSLQAGIQPHFLFNSLNTLSALTRKDPERAEAFVLEMSAVYRYLLQSNTALLTTLEEELDFIRSFLHLLQTRFEGELQYSIDISPGFYAYRIPPLTLQILVENAVKHNELSEDAPLQLRLYTDEEGFLVVTNTLRKKSSAGLSTGFGLANICSRYRLLHNSDVVITQTEHEFKVALPLIKPAVHEYIDH